MITIYMKEKRRIGLILGFEHTQVSNSGVSLLDFISNTKDWSNRSKWRWHELTVNDRVVVRIWINHGGTPPWQRPRWPNIFRPTRACHLEPASVKALKSNWICCCRPMFLQWKHMFCWKSIIEIHSCTDVWSRYISGSFEFAFQLFERLIAVVFCSDVAFAFAFWLHFL